MIPKKKKKWEQGSLFIQDLSQLPTNDLFSNPPDNNLDLNLPEPSAPDTSSDIEFGGGDSEGAGASDDY